MDLEILVHGVILKNNYKRGKCFCMLSPGCWNEVIKTWEKIIALFNISKFTVERGMCFVLPQLCENWFALLHKNVHSNCSESRNWVWGMRKYIRYFFLVSQFFVTRLWYGLFNFPWVLLIIQPVTVTAFISFVEWNLNN